MTRLFLSVSRVRFFFLLLLVPAFAAVIGELCWLQHKADYYREKARKGRQIHKEIKATRGSIVDFRGGDLARTRETWDVFVDPWEMEEHMLPFVKSRLMKELKAKKTMRQGEFNALAARRLPAVREENIKAVAKILGMDVAVVRRVFQPTIRKFRAPAASDSAPAAKTEAETEAERLGDSPFSLLSRSIKWAFRQVGRDLVTEIKKENARKKEEKKEEKKRKAIARWRAEQKRLAAAAGVPDESAQWREEELVLSHNVPLAKNISPMAKMKIEEMKIPGFRFEQKFVREYPEKKLAAHLVGYVDKKGNAIQGLEKEMDWCLKGEDGILISEVDRRGDEIRVQRIKEVLPNDGKKVELTLDAEVQRICEEAAERAALQYTPEAVTIIVSEPKTGRLLAMANWPTFDLSDYGAEDPALTSEQNKARRENRALGVGGFYEPGSVFKIIPIGMALNERALALDDTFVCGLPKQRYRGRNLDMMRDEHPGTWNVRDIVRMSSNHGAVLIAMRVTEPEMPDGEMKFYNYIRAFGIGRPTGIFEYIGKHGAAWMNLQFPEIDGGEVVAGLLKPGTRSWKKDPAIMTRLPAGYSVEVTPTQMHYAMCVVANDGKLMTPLIVNRLLNADGSVFRECRPRVRSEPLHPAAARTLAGMLRDVCGVPGGTAYREANIPGYEVAGKTGTAQKRVSRPDGRKEYSRTNHVASFSGFFPASDPRLAVTVVIDDPKLRGVGYGGKVAAPVFREVAVKIIDKLNIPKPSPPPPAAIGETPVP
ncbi:MAG: penicillin-binding protein 2 [Opitutaceae bacterium]|jgi:cell division protein FtsI/penicillin-binding protein 2|nr:penicillin-binding protein 2 [Opitutaceae bacterium]